MSTQPTITEEDLKNLKEASSSLKEISESLSAINSFSLAGSIADISTVVINISQYSKVFENFKSSALLLKKQLTTIFNNAANDAISGFETGMSLGRYRMDASILRMIKENVEKPTKKGLESKSPSKLMMRISQSIPDGMCLGIEDGLRDVKKSMSKLTDAVEEPAKGLSKFKFSLGGISAIAGGVGLAVGAFGALMSSNDELREKMEAAFAKIKEAFAPVMDAVMGLFDAFTTGGEGSCSMMDTIASVAGSLAEVLSGIIEAISGIFREHGDTIMAVVSVIGAFVSEVAGGLVSVLGGAFDIIMGIFTGNGEKIKEGFADVWAGIKAIFGGFGDFFSGLWDKIVGVFGKIGTRVGDAIGGAFKSVVNSILGFAEDTLNKFIKAVNKAIKLINGIPGVEIPKLPVLNIPKLAVGGLVDPGQFFIAREAGPELVGSFGVRSAVMNNNQIVDAVSAGVYRAVKEAMASDGGSYTFNINNHLDGREIGRQVIKYHNGLVKQYGSSPLMI